MFLNGERMQPRSDNTAITWPLSGTASVFSPSLIRFYPFKCFVVKPSKSAFFFNQFFVRDIEELILKLEKSECDDLLNVPNELSFVT